MSESPETRYASPRLRRAATRLLALEAGEAPATSERLAAASGRLLDTLTQGVAQVVGPAGVRSILLRAVKLQKPEFAFLDERIASLENGASVVEQLRACLQEHDPEVIRQVSVVLFATFAGLLASVIGDSLTWAILGQIWPDTLLPELQETEQ